MDSLRPIPEARERLGKISHETFYKLIRSGRLRTVTIGRRRFVPDSEIDRYITEGLEECNREIA